MSDKQYTKYVKYDKKILFIGCGSVGQGSLPLFVRHIDMPRENIRVLTKDDRGKKVCEALGITFIKATLTRENYEEILTPLINPGDFVVNVSVDVASVAIIKFASQRGAMYLDTVIEPWLGGYTDLNLTPSLRSNYAQREEALEFAKTLPPNSPTSILCHGANPGLVSHWTKIALLQLAKDIEGREIPEEVARKWGKKEWADLAHQLNVKVIHVSERDTQKASIPKAIGEFVNTWSVDGFVGEGSQPSELGWGSHEKHFPVDGHRHAFGRDSAIYLDRPGIATRVRSWAPNEGPFHAFIITHNESISLADFFTVRDGDGKVLYRPTVHYAYHPCDDAVLSMHELAGKNYAPQSKYRLLGDEIVSGIDELGVLLMGHKKGAYWYGSHLSIEETRRLCPYNNATGLQVTCSVLAAVIWGIENPNAGIVEPEDIDHVRIMEIARPYLGPMVGSYTDWTPIKGRNILFPEKIDESDPWQFFNFRVTG